MRSLAWGAVLLGLAGCRLFERGDKPVDVPVQNWIDAPDQVLPNGVVGEPYDAVVAATGGQPPYSWTAAPDAVLPVGLVISGDGHVVGTPAEAGQFTFAVILSDLVGRENRVDLTVTIAVVPQVVACGETVSGTFEGSALGPYGPDLTEIENLAWLAIDVPTDLTTRVELFFDNTANTELYVELPSLVVGSGDLYTDYVQFDLGLGTYLDSVQLDASTNPSLTGYLTQPLIPLLLVGESSGRWEMTVECTDGPIFTRLAQYPTRLGDPFEIDYDLYGSNDGVRFWTEDELPEWMTLEESTGKVLGTAMAPGAWEFTIQALTLDGRTRAERTIIGVYEVIDVACGDELPLDTSEGYLDGEFIAFYDPRGYGVFRLPLADATTLSAVTLGASGSSNLYLGLAMPNPDWLRFYGGAEQVVNADLYVDPHAYPAIEHYLDPLVGELYFTAAPLDPGSAELTVTVDCDLGPRPNFAGMPVVPALTESSFQLEGIGGAPPYTWTATGLPSGLKLSPSGELSGQTGALGTYDVDVTVSDKFGGSRTESYSLYVGADEACAGYKQIECNDSVDGEFEEPFFVDGNGKDSTKVFCVVVDEEQALSWEIYADDGDLRIDIADPGRSADDMFNDDVYGTFIDYVPPDTLAGAGVDQFSWPNIDDFENLPLLLAIRTYDPGTWTVHLTCP